MTAGLNLSKRGGFALIRDGKLEFSHDIHRSAAGDVDLAEIPRILARYSIDVAEIDEWAIDGWDGAKAGQLRVRAGGSAVTVDLAPYLETEWTPNPGEPAHLGELDLGGRPTTYASYAKVAGMVAAAYCTSPFAVRQEPAVVLVWDAGSFPRLYHVDSTGQVEPGGALLALIGDVYALAYARFGPNRGRDVADQEDTAAVDAVITRATLGTARDELTAVFREAFHTRFEADTPVAREYRETITGCGTSAEPSHTYTHEYLALAHAHMTRLGAQNDDVIASLYRVTEELLLDRLDHALRDRYRGEQVNLCFTGSCALDVTLNSTLRRQSAVKELYVPPFPDASGSAIGVAAAHLGRQGGLRALDWSPRLGPELARHPHMPPDWSISPCRPEELARLIHVTGRPAVVLYGRAQLGPRPLGARCVLAPAVDPAVRDHLNQVTGHDQHRPLTPICLAEHVAEVFEPSGPDPYSQFEHRVRAEWVDRIPAAAHPDGTTRMLTITREDNPVLRAILREYRGWSGVPVLAMTGAGARGSGFFQDTLSALTWGEIDLVWSEGVLYRRVRRPLTEAGRG
ncbi:carbamoyltransferase N-terminal domain-containing protein [Actinokineospora sp.]|uniref:carbamoyltransferase N-terminal domain-containing protein n=1 Tax=Actinokineospora sp. TaxID=1872133 RepID=UPI004037AECD